MLPGLGRGEGGEGGGKEGRGGMEGEGREGRGRYLKFTKAMKIFLMNCLGGGNFEGHNPPKSDGQTVGIADPS